MDNTTTFTIHLGNESDIERLFRAQYSVPIPLNFTVDSTTVNWTNWTQDLSTLNFRQADIDLDVIGTTVGNLFNPEKFSYPVICAYAISGQYGFLPRLAYYLLLIFCPSASKTLVAIKGCTWYSYGVWGHYLCPCLCPDFVSYKRLFPSSTSCSI